MLIAGPSCGPHARAPTAAVAVGAATAGPPSESAPARGRVTPRLQRTLAFLAAHPGVANTELQRELDIAHPSQMSRYLHNLRDQGLVAVERHGRRRSWSLTVAGHQLLESTAATPAR